MSLFIMFKYVTTPYTATATALILRPGFQSPLKDALLIASIIIRNIGIVLLGLSFNQE